jgi:hypothetical protein
MKSFQIILFFISICLSVANAFDLPFDCKPSKSLECITCKNELPQNSSLNELAAPVEILEKLSFLEEKVSRLQKVNETLKKSLAPLLRTLRDGTTEPTFKESREEIKSIKADFDRLVVLSKESISLQRKFDICITNCSSSRRLEIADELVLVQKLRTSLFIKQPLLANKAFEERMISITNTMMDNELLFANEVFEKDLLSALLDNLGKIEKRGDEYFKFENDPLKPYNRKGNTSYVDKYLDNVTSHFPNVLEDVVKSSSYDGSFSNHDTKLSACFYSEKFKKHSDRAEYTEMGIDAGLFILPLFAGPVGRLGVTGIELVFGERLAIWGLRSLDSKKAISATSLVFQTGIAAQDLNKLKNLSEECRKSEVKFLTKNDETQLKEFRDCQKNLGEKIFLSEVGAIALVGSNLSKSAIKFLTKGALKINLPTMVTKEVSTTNEISNYIYKNGLDQLKKGQLSVEFSTPTSGVFSVMDLKALEKIQDPVLKKIPEDYWRYVGSIYSERLNLTKDEIESFIKSSLEMSPRTKLVLNTEKSPLIGAMKIKGGVGVVEAKGPGELLPLEKATGIKIDKKPNEKIVEIVRLSVGKDSDAEQLSTALVSQATSLIVQDKSISRVFIFTSRIHARLYRKMGVPMDKIKELDKRDVIIEFTRSDLERVIQKKMILDQVRIYFPERFRTSSIMANS